MKKKLLPILETEQTKLKFCIAQRNFRVGTTIMDNIIMSIEKSKQVIFIVSKFFLQSKWCREELVVAHQVSSCQTHVESKIVLISFVLCNVSIFNE